MEPDNKCGKRKRGRRKIKKPVRPSPELFDLDLSARKQAGSKAELHDNVQKHLRFSGRDDAFFIVMGLTALHVACLYGQLPAVRLLVASGRGSLGSTDSQGRQPIHMVLSSQSSPNTSACLAFLLQNSAEINVTTNSGLTPLHVAASEGLLECSKILVQAGADVLAEDNMGHTPLDAAHIWCHRKVARYLKSCVWKAEKQKEMENRKQVQALYSDLVDMAKLNKSNKKTVTDEKVAEWANKKGFPLLKDFSPRVQVSQYHSRCLSSDQDSPDPKYSKALLRHQSRQPPAASAFRPWTIYLGLQPDKPLREPDLRDCVTVWRDSSSTPTKYTTKWDSTPRVAPDLPLDVLKRVLFPRAFPSRIVSIQQFEPQDITAVQHRGCPQTQNVSPWTKVAMLKCRSLDTTEHSTVDWSCESVVRNT